MKNKSALIALAVFMLMAAIPGKAAAQTELAPVPDLVLVPDLLTVAELDEARGGYMTPGGVNFEFGAIASAFIDGELVLRTELSAAQADAYAVRPGADGGETTIRQLSGADFLGNVVTNTTSDRTVALNLDITVLISNFAASQKDFAFTRDITALENAAAAALAQNP